MEGNTLLNDQYLIDNEEMGDQNFEQFVLKDNFRDFGSSGVSTHGTVLYFTCFTWWTRLLLWTCTGYCVFDRVMNENRQGLAIACV